MSNRIVTARKRSGMTAGQVRKHRPDLFALEAAQTVSNEHLSKAADAYHVSVCWISGHDGQVLDDGMMKALDKSNVSDTDRLQILDFAMSLGNCSWCQRRANAQKAVAT